MFPKSFNSYPLSLSLPLVICWIKGRSGKRGCDHRTTERVQIRIGSRSLTYKISPKLFSKFPHWRRRGGGRSPSILLRLCHRCLEDRTVHIKTTLKNKMYAMPPSSATSVLSQYFGSIGACRFVSSRRSPSPSI